MTSGRVGSMLMAVLVCSTVTGCPDPPPPSIEAGPWAHDGAEETPTCTADSEIEPNGDVAKANVGGDGACSSQELRGAVADDVDVFRVGGPSCKDSFPTATLKGSEKDTRLCVFVVCAYGRTGISNCTGDPSEAKQLPISNYLPEGMRGCCRIGDGRVTVEANCDGQYALVPTAKPEWHTFFVVDRLREKACSKYSIDYHF